MRIVEKVDHGFADRTFRSEHRTDTNWNQNATGATTLAKIIERKTVGWQPTCECGKGKWIDCTECGGTGELTERPQQVFDDVRDDPDYHGASAGPILGCPNCLGSGAESEGPRPDTEPGTVLDPFSGAGTTGVVCIEEDRNYIGIELSEEYCEMQRKRLEKATRSKQHRLELC